MPWHAGANEERGDFLLALLPTRPFLGDSDALKRTGAAEAAECTICCLDYEEGDEICVLPMCMHAYHASCILDWLGKQSTCPVCTRNVVDDLKALRAVQWPSA